MEVKSSGKPTVKDVLSERGSRYGKFSDLSVIDQALKHVMHQAPNWDSLEPHHKTALEMIQHKVSRILNGDPDYEDNWVDIEGYARIGREPEQ